MLMIQTSELITRLRRFLGLTGDAAVGLSETASPVVALADVSGNPYRTDQLRWVVTQTRGALAANFNGVRLATQQLPNNLVAVLDQIVINNTNATAQIFNVHLDIGGSPLTTIGVSKNVYLPELPLNPGGGVTNAQAPFVCQAVTNAAFIGGGFDAVIQVTLPPSSSLVLPNLDIQLRTDQGIGVYPNAQNLDVSASFSGRLFQIRA